MDVGRQAHTLRVRRVLRVFRQATAEQYLNGADWYRNAHGLAVSLDPADPRRAAGVIAALSPMVSWARNVELAGRAYADGYASGALGMSCRAADRILGGEDPADVLVGPKVSAFFRLIADPADTQSVCVDRHAIAVAVGRRLTDAERQAQYAISTPGRYALFAEAYRRAAEIVGHLPSQVQAITWVRWRELHAA